MGEGELGEGLLLMATSRGSDTSKKSRPADVPASVSLCVERKFRVRSVSVLKKLRAAREGVGHS